MAPGAQIPGVEVRADQDNLAGLVAPGHLAHHVGAVGVGQQPGREQQVHARGPVLLEHAVQRLGVRDRERRGRDLVVVLALAAGVGHAIVIGADRPDEQRHGAHRLCRARAGRPRRDGLAVAAAVAGATHDRDRGRQSCRARRLRRAPAAARGSRASTTPAVIPPGGVATLPPSAATTMERDVSPTISARASPRSQWVTFTGSACTFAKAHPLHRVKPPGDGGAVGRGSRRAGDPPCRTGSARSRTPGGSRGRRAASPRPSPALP